MKGFCSQCNETVPVRILEIVKKGKIRGRDIQYMIKEQKCSICGEVLVSDINEEEILREAFRDQENLISVEEIREILAKYKIGKRPLSLLLGWGEGTLTRYLNNDLPTKQYSGTLKRIKDDPAYYEELLEENRKAITYQAYSRSKKALEISGYSSHQMTMESICSENLEETAGLLLLLEPDMPLDKLQILLYHVQGFHLAFWKEELFPEECLMEFYVPSYSPIATLYATGRLQKTASETDEKNLTESESLLVETVMKWIGCFNSGTLRKIFLAQSPLLERGCIEQLEDESMITKELIKLIFDDIVDKYHMNSILDVAEYCQDLIRKI